MDTASEKSAETSWFICRSSFFSELNVSISSEIFYFDKTFGILYKKAALTLALFITMY